MEDALRFFRVLEVWIYLLLGLGALYTIRNFILAWQALREAAFGLERESAQSRLSQATILLVFILSMAIAEFVLVSVVAPAIPEAMPLPSPTLDLMATPTTTLPATQAAITTTPVAEIDNPACIPGLLEITTPTDGSQVSGVVEILGSVNIPNFGFYKIEMKRNEDAAWLTVLAGNEVKIDSTLGSWNTSLLSPGGHQLSLVATDNAGQTLPPCIIQVNISTPVQSPQP